MLFAEGHVGLAVKRQAVALKHNLFERPQAISVGVGQRKDEQLYIALLPVFKRDSELWNISQDSAKRRVGV